jgi:Methyltransferase small domain
VNSELEIAAASASLLGDTEKLSCGEIDIIRKSGRPVQSWELVLLKNSIRSGYDVLGEAFSRVRSSARRREAGAIYSPSAIVDSMCDWAVSVHDQPERIVDPGAGSGRFLWAAAKRFPLARLVAIEKDPLAALMLRANAKVLGFADRLDVHVADYCSIDIERVDGTTLFIGNPPYVRHHALDESIKQWLFDTARKYQIKASKLAGLHIYFFLKTLELAKPGDIGAFITSSEWLDVNYGSLLRKLLAKELGGTALHILDPAVAAFPGTQTTATITCFNVGQRPKTLKVREVPDISSLNGLKAGEAVSWDIVGKTNRWSSLTRPKVNIPSDHIELGELFRVHRGQVTGANNIWVTQSNPFGIDSSFLIPTITRARELIAAGEVLEEAGHLKFVLDLPKDLDSLTETQRKAIDQFLDWAKLQGAADGFVARNRQKWWSVGLKTPAPIVCTYMARRAPAFVRNKAGARLLNIAHGLYPRETLSDQHLSAVVKWLRGNVKIESGRLYAGGLAKFEPKEVERLPVPSLDAMLAGFA